MPTHRDLPPQTVQSLLETEYVLGLNEINHSISVLESVTVIHHARNWALHTYLKTTHEVIFWVDSDTTWKARDFLKFLLLAKEVPCLFAQAPLRKDPLNFPVKLLKDGKQQIMADKHGLLPVRSGGLCFACIQRPIIENLAKRAKKIEMAEYPGEQVAYVFKGDSFNGTKTCGEDFGFWEDIRGLGYEVKLDPMVELGHIGSKTYAGKYADVIKVVA